MKIGLQYLNLCDEMWVLGMKITEGMAAEIAAALRRGPEKSTAEQLIKFALRELNRFA